VRPAIASAGAGRRPRLHLGRGALDLLGAELARIGSTRPLVLTGAGTARSPRLATALARAGRARDVRLVDEVRPGVTLASVEAVARAVREHAADCLVGVGGGAALTTARAANVLAHEAGTLARLSTSIDPDGTVHSPRLSGSRLPTIAVVSTPTTAATKAGAAVTLDGHRHALYDPRTRAACVLVDDELSAEAPPSAALAATSNAYVMAVEGVLASPEQAYAAVQLRGALADLADVLEGWSARAWPVGSTRTVAAALVVGSATDLTGGALTAALSHTLGPHADVANGVLDALLLPHVLEHGCLPGASTLDRDPVAVCRGVLLAQGWPTRLRDAGVRREQLPDLARAAALDDVSAWAGGALDPSVAALAVLRSAW
jgi:alcohol dehydrogenase